MHKIEKFNGSIALLIEMENGRRISLVESQILFGVQNRNAFLTIIKRDGNIVR